MPQNVTPSELLPVLQDTVPQPLPARTADAVAAEFKALADSARLRLFLQIAGVEGEVCVCHLDGMGLSQPTVSHHLRKLRETGLVTSDRRGTWVHYRTTERGERMAALVADVLPGS
ncbi:winged helix-turn-helix transcriptional regulator [Kocuria sp. JC486]|uniref:ArsR/SmtB family transcription factor n=1 Tax=Kocuria sp. JC486 TaxID=1970736 RepID=UPI00141E0AAF|nr:metalloregulator ArsR/SmtB family transcription factor [Kocuria sp. JC486]NHU84468.1 winged helix-turn-helix transcriptional regulator [Kocuria sp. JC486]